MIVTVEYEVRFKAKIDTDAYHYEREEDETGVWGNCIFDDNALEDAFYSQVEPTLKQAKFKDIELLDAEEW